ncbi:hypothetical protein F5Y17DRAFT_478687 [Xylariaceae sp. FL0594]|nr:hypothetical protein F5Y17DRAFT_478687 [Xylariaceae sp. FL0594]
MAGRGVVVRSEPEEGTDDFPTTGNATGSTSHYDHNNRFHYHRDIFLTIEERRAKKRAARARASSWWIGCFPWMQMREQEMMRRLCVVVALVVCSFFVVLVQARRGIMVGRYAGGHVVHSHHNATTHLTVKVGTGDSVTVGAAGEEKAFLLKEEGEGYEHEHVHDEQEEKDKVPGQCTTWPVDLWDGSYESPIHIHGSSSDTNKKLMPQSFAPPGGWVKPSGISVKAVIFYGRKRTVDILDCYLLQNMVSPSPSPTSTTFKRHDGNQNGKDKDKDKQKEKSDGPGFLDEVWFMVHTGNEDDLAYLDELVAKRQDEGHAYKIVRPGNCQGFNYACMWDPVTEDDTIYVKIDDDIIFIQPDAIPQLVWTRIAEPHPFAVSANLVNSPLTGYKHYGVGAIHPFVPDPSPRSSLPAAAERWRPSDWGALPASLVQGFDRADYEITMEDGHEHHQVDDDVNAEIDKRVLADPNLHYEGHPWLLLTDDSNNSNNSSNSSLHKEDPLVSKTPMGINTQRVITNQEGDGDGGIHAAAWRSWMISAQQQYSLLWNLEHDEMWRYHFGTRLDFPKTTSPTPLTPTTTPGGEQLHDTSYIRYNLNFVAVWGHDIRLSSPISADDEQDITSDIPARLNRPFVIDTRAVVAHFSFFPQSEGVRRTDLLDRWRAFANEGVCPVVDGGGGGRVKTKTGGGSPGSWFGLGGKGGKGEKKKGEEPDRDRNSNLKKPFDPRCPGF